MSRHGIKTRATLLLAFWATLVGASVACGGGRSSYEGGGRTGEGSYVGEPVGNNDSGPVIPIETPDAGSDATFVFMDATTE